MALNEYAPDPHVALDHAIADTYVRYAHMLAARGYVQSTLGGMVIRVPRRRALRQAGRRVAGGDDHRRPGHHRRAGGQAAPRPATSVGHQMNREILRLRADVDCVIHLHHDETIALLASGTATIRSFSGTFSFLMQKPLAYLPAHVNVEEDVAPIKTFIQDTNCVVMKRHGITVLGRTVSECYHRVNVYAAEVKRQIIVELLCAAKGTKPETMTEDEMKWMFAQGDRVVYPDVAGGA